MISFRKLRKLWKSMGKRVFRNCSVILQALCLKYSKDLWVSGVNPERVKLVCYCVTVLQCRRWLKITIPIKAAACLLPTVQIDWSTLHIKNSHREKRGFTGPEQAWFTDKNEYVIKSWTFNNLIILPLHCFYHYNIIRRKYFLTFSMSHCIEIR